MNDNKEVGEENCHFRGLLKKGVQNNAKLRFQKKVNYTRSCHRGNFWKHRWMDSRY